MLENDVCMLVAGCVGSGDFDIYEAVTCHVLCYG